MDQLSVAATGDLPECIQAQARITAIQYGRRVTVSVTDGALDKFL